MPQRRPSRTRSNNKSGSRPRGKRSGVRVIGGELRGRWIDFDPDPRTRPMKDRTREAVFNLIGKPSPETLVLDLFAGTGAMTFESLSRGAGNAICIERHRPTARRIEAAAETLGVADRIELIVADTLVWWRRESPTHQWPTNRPWWVFLCPPYDLAIEHARDFDSIVADVHNAAPADSMIVIEIDSRYDLQRLPPGDWDVRQYAPAIVAVSEIPDIATG